MPEAVLSPEQWDAVKLSNITGVADTELSEQWGITCEAIRQRRFRDPIWKAAFEAKSAVCNSVSQKGPETASLAKKVASTISENVSSLSENNLLLANQLAQKGLHRAMAAIEGVELENMADIERAVKISAIAGKWSQPQVSVNQAFAFGGGQEDSAIVECETEIVEDAGNYGDAFDLEEE
jgi:hypothetical protein